MKQKITNPDIDIELVAQNKSCDDLNSHSTEETNTINNYLPAYAYPFMPIDLTIVVDELRKMVKHWFAEKSQHQATYKNKIDENI